MREPELKPCPFCGYEPIKDEDTASTYERFIISCGNQNCALDVSTGWIETLEQAINKWNSRAGVE